MSEETKIEKLYAWHAVKAGGTTPYLTVAEVLGQKYTLADDKPIVPCKHGYHASVKAEDAAKYAYGLRLRRVLLEGEIVTHGYDKHAARSRTPLWEIPEDTTIKVLVEWSFWCVETVARPSLVSALRNAGLMDHAAQIDALPQITDSSSAGEFLTAADAAARAAARAARAAARAAAREKMSVELQRRRMELMLLVLLMLVLLMLMLLLMLLMLLMLLLPVLLMLMLLLLMLLILLLLVLLLVKKCR